MSLPEVDSQGNYRFIVLHQPQHHNLHIYTRRNIQDDIRGTPMRGYYWISDIEGEENGPFESIYKAAKDHDEVCAFYKLSPVVKEEPKRSNVIKLDFKARVRIP